MSKKITLKSLDFAKARYAGVDAVIIPACKECLQALGKAGLPQSIRDAVQVLTDHEENITDPGKITCTFAKVEKQSVKVIVAGFGSGKNCKPVELRKAAGNAIRTLQNGKYAAALVVAPILLNPARPHYLKALVEGLLLGNYEFNVYKTDAHPVSPLKVTVLSAVKNSAKVVSEAEIIADKINYVRELVNEPGNVLNPAVFAEEAKQMAKACKLKCEILDESAMAKKHMGAILAVGRGSHHGARMITLKYHGGEKKPWLALVGKGITFDSGGISLKPDDNMGEMKDDMTGAGDVLGALGAIAMLKLPVNVMGIMACAENMPGGDAQRPGDIVTSASGKTIEVISTDAEGRMVLADAVWYACEQGASKVVDIATLTGAVSVALGKETSAIISNNSDLTNEIMASGKRVGEGWWELPSLPDLQAAIKSDVADVKNSAGRPGGCITGGLFVGAFIKKDISWAHLDIGGTSTATKTSGHIVQGGTAFGTATLIELARSMA
jgi:leucyl aminopeptidase